MFALMMPISVVMMVLVKLPVLIALLTFLPFYIFGLQACVDLAGLLEFIDLQKRQLRWRVLAATALGVFPYQWLLAASALRAIVRQLGNRMDWEKTAHTGIHRQVGHLESHQEPQEVGEVA
jgi:hypothetical protein